MLSLDTEDDSKGNVTIIDFFDGAHHHTFTGKELREDAWYFLQCYQPEICWACNLEYDLINLYGMEWIPKMVTLQYNSAGLMRASATEYKVSFIRT